MLESATCLPIIDRLCAALSPLQVLALVAPEATELSVSDLAHGAAAVASTTSEPEQLLSSLNATAHGIACLPLSVAQSIAETRTQPLGDQERRWLQQLAHGDTIAQIARAAGYAERSFDRRLRGVYLTLGKTTRTEALLEAQRQGLL